MRDKTVMENLAESYISAFLLRHEILVARPMFDIKGADLIAMLEVNHQAHFCSIQSKGRSLTRERDTAEITIPCDYVDESFIVMIYVDDGNLANTLLYCCFPSDLKTDPWKERGDAYVLSFSKVNYEEHLRKFKVDATSQVADRIKDVIRNADMAKVMAAITKAQNSHSMKDAIDAINEGRKAGLHLPDVVDQIGAGQTPTQEQ